MKNSHFDIVVVGGGTAGVVAAIQGARHGARTLLVEKNGCPGGTMTSAGIAQAGLFYAWRKQVIAGIGWELLTAAVAESGMRLPAFETQIGMTCHPNYQVKYNALILAAICDEKMLRSGVNILYHTMVSQVEHDGNEVALELCTLEGAYPIRARRVIDCTGDASVIAMAGYEVIHPDECQPGTICCRASGYDYDSLDREALRRAAEEAVAAGELAFADLGWNHDGFSMQFLHEHGHNANHIFPELPSHSAEGRSLFEIDGRRSLLRAYRFLRRQPGLEHLKFEATAAECGVRESAVIRGEATVTAEQYATGHRFPDAVCNAFYPIDLHKRSSDGVTPLALQEGVVPQLPLGALIPRGSDLFLAAGRCVSSDRLANSALRVQATVMAGGQAAAAAACASLEEGVSVRRVNLKRVREILRNHGAIVPENPNVDETN